MQNTMNDFLMLSNNQFIENVSNAILIFPSGDVSIPTVLSLDQTDLETSLWGRGWRVRQRRKECGGGGEKEEGVGVGW